MFRSLKSGPGLRPIFHQKQERSDGHLFISVLVCQAVQLLRRRMREAERQECWAAVRQTPVSLQRTTTSFRRREGGVLHVRKTARADAEQAEVYRAMGIGAPPRNLGKTLH